MSRIATIVLLFAAAVPVAAKGDNPPELQEWIRGPVRYIARVDEAKAFKKLEADNDRALFIERFWARRDPSPGTLGNEYRQLFWERVQQANAQFIDSPRPGWMTDRGKIYVLYGGPTEVRDYPDLATRSTATAGRGLIRWIYDRPADRRDLNATIVVPFVRDSGGEYKLSRDPDLSSVFFDENAIAENRDSDIKRFLELVGTPSRSELSVMLDLGRMQEVPPQAQVLLERVETAEAYRTITFGAAIHRYRPPGERKTTVVVTIDVGWVSDGATPSVVARFSPQDATTTQRTLGEDSFAVIEAGGRTLAQSRIRLGPGRWDVTLLVVDPITAQTGLERRVLVLDAPTGELALSDTTWAQTIQPLPYRSLVTYDEPYHIGAFRVLPRLEPSFTIGQPLTLFYEVYGGMPPYRVEYRLSGQEADGSWVELGTPATVETDTVGQAWELQTSDRWPTGEYRITVEVLDAEQRAVRRVMSCTLAAEGTADDEVGPGVVTEAPAATAGSRRGSEE